MTALPLRFWSYYLTQAGQWRQEDWSARSLVCGAKQEPFKGELRITIDKVPRTFRTDTIEEFVTWVMGKMGSSFRADIAGPVSFVPIPNSNVAVGSCVQGRTHALAEHVAAGHGAGSEVVSSIIWDAPRQKAHKSKEYRRPELYQPHMHYVAAPRYPVVLFDDVVTSGSQMIAAARVLRDQGVNVVHGLALAKAVSDQREGAFLKKHSDTLEIDPPVFNFDDIF